MKNNTNNLLELSPNELNILIPGALHFSIWIIPEQEYYDYLVEIIEQISCKYIAPYFEPHVSIYTGIYTNEDDIENIALKCASSDLISLHIKMVSYTENIFKSLYIDFDNNFKLERISQAINRELKYPMHYSLQPHLSLMYKEMSPLDKEEIIKQIGLNITYVKFNRFRIITPTNTTQGWTDISKWKTILDRNLKT